MDVSVCIVNWNTKELLANCIKSLQEKTTGVSYEVIIVDNNSADGSSDMVRQRYPQCKLVASKENLGFGRGNNRGLQEATGKYIFYLNPDTVLATNALYGMFQYMESNPDAGAVGCRLLNQDRSIQFTCARTFPTLFNQFCDLMLLNRLFPKYKLFSTIEMSYWNHRDSRDIDCLSGACIFTRRDVVNTLKGFDENFFMYAEDVDLCYRIRKEGWKLHYLATEEIYHLEGQSSKKRSQKLFSFIVMRESNQIFFSKHYGKVNSYLYRALMFTGALFRMLVAALSVLELRQNRLSKQGRKDIYLKYFNLLLWSMGPRRYSSIATRKT